jgi:hypothetical protein
MRVLFWPRKRGFTAAPKRLKERAGSFSHASVKIKPQNTASWIQVNSSSLREQFRKLVRITTSKNRDPGPILVVEAKAVPNAEEPDLLPD